MISSIARSKVLLLNWFPWAPSFRCRIGETEKMNSFSGNLCTIFLSKLETSATLSRLRLNSLESRLRQFDTISPVAMCSKHHAVPRVIMTLDAEFQNSEAFSSLLDKLIFS